MRGAYVRPIPGRTITRTTAKGSFAVATREMPGRRVHLIARAASIWAFGQFDGFMATTRCARRLVSVSIHSEAPDQFELCDDCALADFSGHCVYHLFDRADALLYIGCTGNLWGRVASHAGSSAFWPLVARITHESFPDRPSALAAEKQAIAANQPPFNLEHTDRAQRRGSHRRLARQRLVAAA